RAVAIAQKLAVPSLTRAWQMLLKGLLEVRDAANPLSAAEMALVRLSYAADLPPTEDLVRSLLEPDSSASKMKSTSNASSPVATAPSPLASRGRTVWAEPASRPLPEKSPVLAQSGQAVSTLEDIVRLARENGARELATQLEINVRLVSLERGRVEFAIE